MKASPLILSLCAALFALSGCSSPCEGVCSSFNECALTERDHQVDCATFCDREQQFEEAAAEVGADTCKAQFDEHIACWEANEAKICDAKDPVCDASATAWTDCMAKFCAVEANATDQACAAQDEGPALPSMGGFVSQP